MCGRLIISMEQIQTENELLKIKIERLKKDNDYIAEQGQSGLSDEEEAEYQELLKEFENGT